MLENLKLRAKVTHSIRNYLDELEFIPAPDFPTGAYIYGLQGVKDAYETGRGRVVMRAKAEQIT